MIHHPPYNNGGKYNATIDGTTAKYLDMSFINHHNDFIQVCTDNSITGVFSGHVHGDVLNDDLNGVCNKDRLEWSQGDGTAYVVSDALVNGYYRKVNYDENSHITGIDTLSMYPINCDQLCEYVGKIGGWLSCATIVDIYDSEGNHTGLQESGEFEYGIPNMWYSYQTIGDDNLQTSTEFSLYKDDNIDYNIIITCLNEEPLNMAFTISDVNNPNYQIWYDSIPVFSGSIATMQILGGQLKSKLEISDPDGALRVVCPDHSTLDTGSITGFIFSNSTGLLGVPVDLYNSLGAIIASTITDDSGYYKFAGLNNGDYSISISTPLGYQAGEETKEIEVKGLPHEVNFELTPLEITPQQRSRGYWAHQLHKAIQNKPKDYTIEDFANLTGLINIHFNNNQINPVDFYSVPQPASQTDSLNVLKKLLHMRNTDEWQPFLKRLANSQLMALMLNVVSGKVSQTEPITTDGLTISQAITYCDMLNGPGHGSPWCRYIRASYILIKANLGIEIEAGLIPLDVIQIAYRIHDQEVLPEGFELSQNYPNPFNPATQINFTLPEATEVNLTIFNVAGQKVTTLLDGYKEAGSHTVTWDGSKFASGVYFYHIKAGEFTATRKMTLLK